MELIKGCGIQLLGFILFLLLGAKSSWIAIIVFLIFAIGGLLYSIIGSAKKSQDFKSEIKSKMREVRPSREDLFITKSYTSNNYESRIALDNKHKKIGLWINKKKNTIYLSPTISKYDFRFFEFPFEDVLSIEIVEDGVSVTKTSKGGALVGGILAGGVGAIVGGVIGTKTTTETINRIDMLITVNDIQNPIYVINFYSDMDATIQTTNPSSAMLVCKEWYSILTHIINEDEKIDKDNKRSTLPSISLENDNVSEKLKELKQLEIEGIITTEDFNEQKQRILNKM